MKKYLLIATLFLGGCNHIAFNKEQQLQNDKENYWYPTSEGSIGGIAFTGYINDEDYTKSDRNELIFVSVNAENYKDSLINKFPDIKYEYIIGNWIKVNSISDDRIVSYLDDLAIKRGESRGYMTPEEIQPLHDQSTERSLDKIKK